MGERRGGGGVRWFETGCSFERRGEKVELLRPEEGDLFKTLLYRPFELRPLFLRMVDPLCKRMSFLPYMKPLGHYLKASQDDEVLFRYWMLLAAAYFPPLSRVFERNSSQACFFLFLPWMQFRLMDQAMRCRVKGHLREQLRVWVLATLEPLAQENYRVLHAGHHPDLDSLIFKQEIGDDRLMGTSCTMVPFNIDEWKSFRFPCGMSGGEWSERSRSASKGLVGAMNSHKKSLFVEKTVIPEKELKKIVGEEDSAGEGDSEDEE